MRQALRAFVWMRWRMLINAFERTSARDTLARFSIAIDRLGPIVALALLIPSAAVLFGLGIVAGFGVATGSWAIPFQVVRFVMLAALAMTLLGPIIMPSRDADRVVRLLLLPISRFTLYVAHVSGALADPWILLMVPVILGVPIGVAIGLHGVAAAIALAAGVAFIVLLAGLTSLVSSIIHLLLRDRRRGDIVTLVVVVFLSFIGLLPSLMQMDRAGQHPHMTRAERRALPPSPTERAVRRAAPYLPSELYRASTLEAQATPVKASVPLGGLVGLALVLQALAFGAFRRVLDMPVSMGARRAGGFGGLWERAIPGLSHSASAVALTQLRLAMRSPRGRQMMITPLLIFAMFGLVLSRRGNIPFPGLRTSGGIGLAIFACVMCLFAHLPFASNQFAIDRAGFTREMLTPLSLNELLVGKAVGNFLIIGVQALICWAVAALLFPGASAAVWISIPLSFASVYLIFTPIAAALSAAFPRTVDLGSIGNRSNAHQAATLLSLLSIAVSVAPAAGLAAVALLVLDRPSMLPVLLAAWCVAAYAICRLLLVPVRRFVDVRREDLGLTH